MILLEKIFAGIAGIKSSLYVFFLGDSIHNFIINRKDPCKPCNTVPTKKFSSTKLFYRTVLRR